MAIEVKGSNDKRWIIVGSPDGDIPPQVIQVAHIERYWFDVDDDETIIVLSGRKRWMRFADDLTMQLDLAIGMGWTGVRHSAEEE